MSKFCPNCGSLGADDANVCGNCGYRFAQPAQPVQPAYQQPAQQVAYQRPAQPAYQQPVQQPAYQRPVQQPAYQQPAYQPNAYVPNPIAQRQGFPKSKIFVIIATLLQIFSTGIYFMDIITLKTDYFEEATSFLEFAEAEDGEYLIYIAAAFGSIAFIFNLLTICTKKFGRYVRQIPQMIIAFLNFGLYSFLVFAVREELEYYDGFKDMLEEVDGKYSDGAALMLIMFVAIFALMIAAAVFQGKEKKAERAAMRGF